MLPSLHDSSASARGRDPSLRSSVSWFESSRRHDARVVQAARTAPFQGAGTGSIPVASTARKVRSAWRRHRSRKPAGARASGFDSYAFHVWKIDLAVARAPSATRLDPTGCGSTPPSSAIDRSSHLTVREKCLGSLSSFARSIATSLHATSARPTPALYAGPAKASRPPHSSVHPFRFPAPRSTSPTRKRDAGSNPVGASTAP